MKTYISIYKSENLFSTKKIISYGYYDICMNKII